MKVFVQPTRAQEPKTEAAKLISLFYAVILTLMIVAQLFTFEAFIELIISFNLPVSDVVVSAVAPVLVAYELFALPFLLRMTVSSAFRLLSIVCGWLVPAVWLAITVSLAISQPAVETVGFLGTAVDLVPGWWAVGISLLFGVMAAWASWGLWPARKANK